MLPEKTKTLSELQEKVQGANLLQEGKENYRKIKEFIKNEAQKAWDDQAYYPKSLHDLQHIKEKRIQNVKLLMAKGMR